MTTPALYLSRDGFSVDPDELSARAGQVDEMADRLHTAAAGPVLLDDGAFGLIGSAVFGHSATTTTAVLSSAADDLGLVVEAVADDLRGCRDSYLTTEDRAEARFVRIVW
jgi:hypothetical protein